MQSNHQNRSRKSFQIGLMAIVIACANQPIANAGLTVTAPSYPSASVGTSSTYHGNLTNVAADTNADIASGGTAVGEYTSGVLSFGGTIGMHTEDCCTADKNAGKVVVVNGDDAITVNAKFTKPSKKYPAWQDYSSQCNSAKSEWNRFRNTVIAHENDHESIANSFYTKSNIESYFDASAMFYEETNCLPTGEVATMKADIKSRFMDTLISVASLIEDDHYDAQEDYHNSSNNKFTTIDVSQECP